MAELTRTHPLVKIGDRQSERLSSRLVALEEVYRQPLGRTRPDAGKAPRFVDKTFNR